MSQSSTRLCLHQVKLALSLVASTITVYIANPSAAQTLKEVLDSDPYRKVAGAAEAITNTNLHKSLKSSKPVTNYELLWHSRKPGSTLLDWIGVRNAAAKIHQVTVGVRQEYAHAFASLGDLNGVRVDLTIQVPRPEFITMAEFRTLASFNKFRPPALEVVADQVVPFEGIEATYYRHETGACSLLFNVAKQGIVNLFVKRCSDSSVMMKFAKALNFERLNSKLNS